MGDLFGGGGQSSSSSGLASLLGGGQNPVVQAPTIWSSLTIPSFSSPGGITPDQQAAAQYGYGEDLLGTGSQFASSGTGQSTMATQAAGGARMKEADTQAQMSDINQSAMEQDYYNQVGGSLSNLNNQLSIANEQNQFLNELAIAGQQSGTNLSDLASLAFRFTPGQGDTGRLNNLDPTAGFKNLGTTSLGVG